MNSVKSLYIHIPFCNKFCPYCDFVKILKNKSYEDLYINKIIKQLDEIKLNYNKFETIYIGGGTPSVLEYNNLEKILIRCRELILDNGEFSIEINPEDINDKLLELLKNNKVNRLSIGVQTFNKTILSSINRNINCDIINNILLAKKYIENINIDLIYGLVGSNLDIVKEDLEIFLSLKLQHISFYNLILEPGTPYYYKKIKEIDEDLQVETYNLIRNTLTKNNYLHYEISNFSLYNFESKHNINYWKNGKYVAIGLGSSGYENNIRYRYTKNFKEYINFSKREEEILSIDSEEKYFLITNMRLIQGFSLDEYYKLFKFSFIEKYKLKINKLINLNLVKIENNYFSATYKGILLLNSILVEFI